LNENHLDEFYDWVRTTTLDKQIRELAWHHRLMPWWWRFPLWLVFKREGNLTVDRVGRIKRHYLDRFAASGAINNFQWSKLRLGIEHPESLALVQRFEADSKFFRSLVVVLLLLGIWFAWQQQPGVAVVCAVLLLLALWRYMEQRHKATNQAYWAILTLEGKMAPARMASIETGHRAGNLSRSQESSEGCRGKSRARNACRTQHSRFLKRSLLGRKKSCGRELFLSEQGARL
jgi:hypothetical protein